MLIAEELLMIALDDVEGTEIEHGDITHRNTLSEGLDAAMQMELIFAGKLSIDPAGTLLVINDTPTGDALLDATLNTSATRIASSTPTYQLGMPLGMDDLKERLLARLVTDDVLRRVQDPLQSAPDRFLWVIPPGVDPASDSLPERIIRKRIQELVLQGAPADERTATLICLVQACRLLQEVFPNDERHPTDERVETIIHSSPLVSLLAQMLQQQRQQRAAGTA
jgi:hypothetical protein